MAATSTAQAPVSFQTHPDRYRHWKLRFEHPQVRCVVVTGALDRVFCAGANIVMLRTSTHAFKVNFCKYTNETRLSIEDASAHSSKRAS